MNRLKLVGIIGLSSLAIVLIVGANWLYFQKQPQNGPPITKKVVTSKNKHGLQFRLSEGEEELPTPIPVVQATPLSDSEAQNVLNRLAPIKTAESDQQEFALRESSLPPPKTGQVVSSSFPPNKNAALEVAPTTGDLQVVRYSPKGAVPIAANLSVTFSQPMVALTSQEEAAENVPVTMTPQPPGRWRWLGTKTLVFEPTGRFPMSTEYQLEVPAGTKSALGQSLANPVKWTFKTPTLTLKRYSPSGSSVNTNPLIFLEFDQEIDKAALSENIQVTTGNSNYRVKLAAPEEIEASAEVKALSSTAKNNYWLAVKVVSLLPDSLVDPLPKNTNFSVTVKAGASSVEGPLKTPANLSFSFRTYSPLQVNSQSCDNYDCPPTSYLYVSFNNNLEVKSLDITKAQLEPKVVGLKIQATGSNIMIHGKFKGRRTYKLKLAKEFTKDIYGQYLEKPTELTFRIGSMPNELTSLGNDFMVLDPFAPPKLPVFSTNYRELRVSIYATQPEEWRDFIKIRDKISSDYKNPLAYKQPVGRLVSSQVIQLQSLPDEQTETNLDLSAALQNGSGQMFVLVEPTVQPKNPWERQYLRKWLQYTPLGLDAAFDGQELLVWANSLQNGKPLAGVEVSLRNLSAVTEADGIAHIKVDKITSTDGTFLVAKKGKDTAILPENSSGYANSSWSKVDTQDYLSWYVTDDRKTYRPGEKVTLKGWVRAVESRKGGDIKLAGEIKIVNYTLTDSVGNKITKGTAAVNPLGGFNTELTLPPTMNLGGASLSLEATAPTGLYGSLSYSHNFQVEEFRRPEFEVSTKASEGPHQIGGHANVTVSANYYAGGTLNNADVNWQVTASPTTYTPPNRSDYTFGKWTPWWEVVNYGHYGRGRGRARYYLDGEVDDSVTPTTESQNFASKTNPKGTHNLRIDFDAVDPARPTSLNVQASVMDVNRQAWTSSSTLLVHPSNLYVGLHSEKTFVNPGEPFVIKAIVTDIDGKAQPNVNVNFKLVRIEYEYDENGQYRAKEVAPQSLSLTSENDAVEAKFLPKEGGSYQLTATIVDEKGRPNETELTLWIPGGKSLPDRDLKQEQIQLIPDKPEYKIGETAQILVQAPFYPAEALMSLRRSGMVKTERFTINSPTYTIKVPIEESYLPNIYLQVDLVGEAERVKDESNKDSQLPKRPAFAVGQLNLSIPPVSRTLTLKATPKEKAIEPGGTTIVDLDLRDSANKPVSNGEVALFVVDEAILALSNYQISNPLNTFYVQRSSGVSDYHLRNDIVLAKPEEIEEQLAQNKAARQSLPETERSTRLSAVDKAPMDDSIEGGVAGGVVGGVIGGNVAPAAPPPPPGEAPARRMANAEAKKAVLKPEPQQPQEKAIRVRENFDALAVFEAALVTDSSGHASVKVKLPDSLTRYRIMAIAVAGDKQFGAGEASLTARMPLMVRPSAPRFLNFGDKFEFPVVVQNQTDAPISVDVAMRATNATLTAGAGRRLTVPANERVEVRIPAAAEMAGTAHFQIGAVAGQWNDAAEVSLPVWTPATTEAFATYGTFDDNAIIQPVKAPADIYKQFGGLEVSTSSTQLQELTDAVLYIVSYPYECGEQVSSRVLTIAALRDVLAAFKATGLPKPEALEAALARDVLKLKGLQNDDGGFSFWQRGYPSDPFVTVHVAHAIVLAQEKGFQVPVDMLLRAQNYLKSIESYIPHYYSQATKDSLVAYSLYVRNRMKDKDIAKAKSLIHSRTLEKLPIEAIGWLWAVLTNDPSSNSELVAIRTFINNRVSETAATAHFVTDYQDSNYLLLASDFRTDAILLDALIGDQPQSDLIPKLVRGLLDHRKAGKWESTQENVFVLLALDHYFATFEKVTPNFVARIWLGDKYAGDHQFQGRTTEKYQVNIPMSYLVTKDTQNLTISKEGTGRVYYRAGMRYAPLNLNLPPAEYGFTVLRKYEAIDNPDDVKQDADGTWHFKAGARVRVKLTMVAQGRRYHVALVDPLPAGLEPLNPALATTGAIPPDTTSSQGDNPLANFEDFWRWRGTWYEHQNFRDERVEAFTSLLWDGVYTYSYVARATTLGTFVVPPTKAEEMYHPETFGRSKTDRVLIGF